VCVLTTCGCAGVHVTDFLPHDMYDDEV
jgi:hypothetical protein